MIKGGWKIGRNRKGWEQGKRNAHPLIPWFTCRQALYKSSAQAQWALYRGANRPCQTIGRLIQGQEKRGLYLLMIGGEQNLFCFPTLWLRTGLFCFLVMYRKKMSMFDPMFGWKSVSPGKVNIRYGDVFRHSCLRKHVSTDTIHTAQTHKALLAYSHGVSHYLSLPE